MDLVKYNEEEYFHFQTIGNASQFAIPFAKYFCKGKGVDIGYCKEEWKYPGAIGADIEDIDNPYHALHLPDDLDYVYSSHCLEHLPYWVKAIEYWSTRIKEGGTLFLYLPHKDQEYWRPWNNRKHLHSLDAEMVKKCMEKFNFVNIFSSKRDLNHSFIVVGEKQNEK
tara:strand:+ start:97 stop:597 length:501 start_codon:yes stop_codon:yes gene_type:complete